MGVYIKGMEMPQKTYAHCMLIKDIDGSVQLLVCTKNSEEMSEWERYDLVPVPPHGDLIDRDEIPYKKIMLDDDDEFYYGVTQPYIDRMPAVIEAEEGE